MGNECCGVRRSDAKQPHVTSIPEFLIDENKEERGCPSLATVNQVQPQEIAERTEAADVSVNISYTSA